MGILHQDHPVSNRTIKSWDSPTRLSQSPHSLPRTPSESLRQVAVTRVTRQLVFNIAVELDRLDLAFLQAAHIRAHSSHG